MNELVSIIVPCFNASKYLFKCLNSLISQTYTNIEIICINDGSQDNTIGILHYYSIFDKRVKIISNDNHGVSFTRNEGIKNSHGKYICFVDSDDYVAENYIAEMINGIVLNKANLVVCGFDTFDDYLRFSVPIKELFLPKNNHELLQLIFDTPIFNPPWNKMFDKKYITHYFNTSYSLGEDILFNCYYARKIGKISFINSQLYYYNINRNNKLTNTFNYNSYSALKELFQCLRQICNEECDFEFLSEYIRKKVIELTNILFYSKLSIRLKRMYFNDLCKDSFWVEFFKKTDENSKHRKEIIYIIKNRFLKYFLNGLRKKLFGKR